MTAAFWPQRVSAPYGGDMADDNDVRRHIESLIEAERTLRKRMDDGTISTTEERRRLRMVQQQLDSYWATLRTRESVS